jgi:hypothetical protein
MTDPLPLAEGDLIAATTSTEQAPGRYALRVPDGWQQGRGAFGGLVLGALVRAMESAEPEKDRKVRSVNAELAGPVMAGEATIEVAELRRGRGLSAWNATLLQGGQAPARASAVLARARSAEAPQSFLPAPSPPPWIEVEPLSGDTGFFPVFARHIEFRNVGPFPFSRASEPVAAGWVRLKNTPASLGAPEIVALADAWWPSAFAVSEVPRPVGTVGFALQLFLPPEPLNPRLPLFHRARVVAGQGGYFVEFRELWTTSGHLLSLNQQTLAWIR